MTEDEAKEAVTCLIDYFKGRLIKTNISVDVMDSIRIMKNVNRNYFSQLSYDEKYETAKKLGLEKRSITEEEYIRIMKDKKNVILKIYR